jgi:hypothetical protein
VSLGLTDHRPAGRREEHSEAERTVGEEHSEADEQAVGARSTAPQREQPPRHARIDHGCRGRGCASSAQVRRWHLESARAAVGARHVWCLADEAGREHTRPREAHQAESGHTSAPRGGSQRGLCERLMIVSSGAESALTAECAPHPAIMANQAHIAVPQPLRSGCSTTPAPTTSHGPTNGAAAPDSRGARRETRGGAWPDTRATRGAVRRLAWPPDSRGARRDSRCSTFRLAVQQLPTRGAAADCGAGARDSRCGSSRLAEVHGPDSHGCRARVRVLHRRIVGQRRASSSTPAPKAVILFSRLSGP